MEAYPVTEFETTVNEDGSIILPKELRSTFPNGSNVIIRIIEGTLSRSLRARKVTEEEIEAVARLQMEQRGDVLRFLTAEGGLSGNKSFRKRAEVLLK